MENLSDLLFMNKYTLQNWKPSNSIVFYSFKCNLPAICNSGITKSLFTLRASYYNTIRKYSICSEISRIQTRNQIKVSRHR